MWLLIDDVRTHLGEDAIARNSTAAMTLLKNVRWEGVMFDHDLGPYDMDGHALMKWAFQHDLMPAIVLLVTSNPVGRQNMTDLLTDNGYLYNVTRNEFTKGA